MQRGEILKKEEGLTVVRLKGKPYQIGYQHGTLFREEINWFLANARKNLCQQEGEVIGRITFPIIQQVAKRLGRFIPKQFQKEMKGIADGAKVNYNFILLENLIEELTAIYHWYLKPLFPPFFKCSCFVVENEEGIIWGRNLDYPFFTEALSSRSVLYVYFPDQGFPFLALGWPGNIGAVTGISRNLSLILLSSPTKHRAFKGIPEEILTRQIIQYSQDLDTASEEITPGVIALGQNLVLVSKEKARVVELSHLKKAFRFLQSQGCLTVTNHFQSQEMQEEQVVFSPRPKETLIPDDFFTLEGSKKREEKLRKLCLSQPVDVKRAIEILDRVSTQGTVQSVVSLPQKEEFWIAKRSEPPVTKGEWLNFKLKDLL